MASSITFLRCCMSASARLSASCVVGVLVMSTCYLSAYFGWGLCGFESQKIRDRSSLLI